MAGNNLLPFVNDLDSAPSVDQQLREAFRSSDVEIPESFTFDREIHRYGHKKRCWYVLFDDGIKGGAFGDWATDHGGTWREYSAKAYTPLEEMQFAQAMAEAKKKAEIARQIKAELAAETAQELWDDSTPATSHDYLTRKGVKSHMARINGDGNLVVPMYIDGELASLQTIFRNGDKLFLKGGRTKGAYLQFGDAGSKVYLAEGFATAATIYEETGVWTMAVFSAHNLVDVSRSIRKKSDLVEIVIVADNDVSGTGMNYATQSSAKYGARVVLIPETGQDANDYRANGGDLLNLLNPESETWLVNAKEFCQKPAPIRWHVKRWIQAEALIMVHGPSGCGKTFVVLDWCLRMACNQPDWMGNKVRPGPVVYLAGEGHHGIKSRIVAWLQHNQYNGNMDLWISKSGCDLDTTAGLQLALAHIRTLPVKPCLIVVDTLHRFLAGDENSAQDTKAMLDSCAVLRDAFGASTLLVHHTGVSAEAQHRARGSSSWKGALEIEISIKNDNGTLTISQMKAKDSNEAEDVFCELQEVGIEGWFDEDEEQVKSAVIISGVAPIKKEAPDQAWKAFSDAFWSAGEKTDEGPYLTKSAWEKALVTISGKSEGSARKYVQTGFENGFAAKLISSGKIKAHKNGFLVIDPVLSSALSI